MEVAEIQPVKLTKKAVNVFMTWTTSRYNNYLGYGTKKENVNLAYHSLLNGHYTWVSMRGKNTVSSDKGRTVFEIECASPVGESGTSKSGSYWSTKQSADDYTIDCINKTITAKHSKRIIKFL